MAVVIRLDVVMALKKKSSLELSGEIGLTPTMLSRIKTGKVKAIRFTTLELLCRALECTPNDIIEFVDDDEAEDYEDDAECEDE